LCARYGIDNSRRTKHGALLDAELLAEVYLELIGARQAQLILMEAAAGKALAQRGAAAQRPIILPPRISDDELNAHRAFIASLGEAPVWQNYLSAEA
jgi:DNA polymerase-3 subunit epsilon